ncbi:hypothetical protein ACFTXM_37055 [Streptomyces sp. NPDC056930]|uniref:hypothetical protein n=1 Tax=Streptomyces sp. NPDC056930 TaxID=3345967 RepID=UPI00362B728A
MCNSDVASTTQLSETVRAQPCERGRPGRIRRRDHTSHADFVGSLRARRNAAPLELATPGLLDDWFVESGMLDLAPGANEAHVAIAVQLREAASAQVAAWFDGRPRSTEAEAGPAVTVVRTGSAGQDAEPVFPPTVQPLSAATALTTRTVPYRVEGRDERVGRRRRVRGYVCHSYLDNGLDPIAGCLRT